MTEASTSATAAASSNSSAELSATFIESSSASHAGRSHSDYEDQEEDEDDDEALFAELDKELDMMEDESNFDHKGDTIASFDMAEFRERRMEELRQE